MRADVDGSHAAKDVVESLRRDGVTFRGAILSDHDFALFRESMSLQTALLCDLTPPCWDAWRRWKSFLRRPIDVQTLSDTVKLADRLLKLSVARYSSNEDTAVRRGADFKHRLRREGLYWAFISPIEWAIDEWFESSTIPAFRVVSQWLSFSSHLCLSDIDLKTELIAEYKKLEAEEGYWEYEEELLEPLGAIMRHWLQGISFEDARPSHGPGACAETKRTQGRDKKYAAFRTDTRLEYFLRRIYPSGERYLPYPSLLSGLKRQSTIVCVPKSMTKNRTISKEPAILQYYQHAIWEKLNAWFMRSIELRSIIDLSHQDYSRELARVGSVDGSYATIDLSSASDTVTLSLAKRLFRGTAAYLPLIGTRSDSTRLPDGTVLKLNKFAPMGSDLCFPIECLVFASVCELAVRLSVGHPSRFNDYRVFGDDIVIRSEYAQKTIELLTRLHFEVNQSKTFQDRDILNFREACGGEYVAGCDVTPLRISRRFNIDAEDLSRLRVSSVEHVSSWVELANAAFDRGYMQLRRAVMSRLSELFPLMRGLPYTDVRAATIDPWQRRRFNELPSSSTTWLTYSWCCTNFRLRTRKARTGDTCRCEYNAVVPALKRDTTSTLTSNSDIDPELCRWTEYWTLIPLRQRKVEWGIEYPPEPIRDVDPLRLVWRRKWITA